MAATIAEIFRYPVKSMGGHALDSARLTANGIPGDRCWTLKDEQRGGIKGGKRFPALMGMQARLLREPHPGEISPPVEITLADGTVTGSQDANVVQVLSQAVGAPVSLWPLLPKDALDHYRRPAPPPGTDPQAALRELFARTNDEPLPDLSSFPEELLTYESPPGTYFDAFPLLIMTRASLAAMTEAAAECAFDVRRFRPNILLDTTDTGFVENGWAARTARLGAATLRFEIACPRCVMTTHGFGDVPRDPDVMRALVRHNGGNLGVYASVTEPGDVAVGDRLVF